MRIVLKYLYTNILISLTILYSIVSVTLKSLSIIDIGIPCFWRMLFGVRCPGCGLTRATSCLAHFDIQGAFEKNPLVFIVVPAISYYIIFDFVQFYKKNKETALDN